MKRLMWFAAAVAVHLGAQAQVTLTRSMQVERVSSTKHVVVCSAEYGGLDPNTRYDAVMFGGGTDMFDTTPFGIEVGPAPSRNTFTDDVGGVFEATFKAPGRLLIKRTFTHDQATLTSYPTHIRYCQGGGRNLTTGAELPRVLLYDYQQQ
jgi:hypothetical protein